jgi:hypothetical protein
MVPISNSFGCGSHDGSARTPSTWDKPVFRSFSIPASMAASQHHHRWISPRWASSSATGMEPSSRRRDMPRVSPVMGTAVYLNLDGKLDPTRCSSGT